MICYKEPLNGGCGITNFSDFEYFDPWHDKKPILDDIDDDNSGAGWGIACFVDDADCREAYEEIISKYNVVFQSPVRTNKNSANPFFFVVFDLYNELPAQDASWSL